MRILISLLVLLWMSPPLVAQSAIPAGGLQAQIDSLLEAAPEALVEGELRAVLVPASPSSEGLASAATAYRAVRGRSYARVVLIGSAPGLRHRRIELLEGDQVTPLGTVTHDRAAAALLRSESLVRNTRVRRGEGERLFAQLPMLQRTLEPGWQLVALQIGRLDERDLTEAAGLLDRLIDHRTLVVLVGDLTGYGPRFGYTPFAPDSELNDNLRDLDMGAFGYVKRHDPDGLASYQVRTGMRGPLFTPLRLLLNLLPSTARVAQSDYRIESLFSGHSVSYLAALFTAAPPEAISPTFVGEGPYGYADMQLLHELASRAVEAAAQHDGRPPLGVEFLAHGMPQALLEAHGVFVTLHKHGRVRGSAGSVDGEQPLYQAVLESAREAALRDRRFFPVSASELDELEIEVHVVTDTAPLESATEYGEGDGITMQRYGREGALLPDEVAEQGLDKERTLERLSVDMGLRANDWRNAATFRRFTTQRFQAPYLPR